MSEAMSLEVLAANVMGSELNTAFTKTRVRLMGPTAGYTDLDAVAAAPMKKTLAVAECKAQGRANQVFQITDYDGLTRSGYCLSLRESAEALFRPSNRWLSPNLQFGATEEAWSGLEHLELWLFANVMVADDQVEAINTRLAREINDALGASRPEHVHISTRVVSTLDLVLSGFEVVERWTTEFDWGVRSGDPVLDALRELVRYKHGYVTGGGTIARESARNRFRDRVRAVLLDE